MKKIIFSAGCLLLSAVGFSQQTMTNSGNLSIHNGGTMNCFGNFSNNSSAALVNNGALMVRGTITNDQASMASGSGTLSLTGTSAQTINGTQPFRTNHLISNNSSGITLNNDLRVSGVHTFSNGLIHSSATPNYLVYEAGSSHSGSNDTRHVTGWVKKIGSTNFTFPVGNNSYLRSVAISGLTAASDFNCHYYTPTLNPNNFTAPIVLVKGNEYWQIDRVSGANAQVTLNWDHSKVAMNNVLVGEIMVANYSGGSWVSRGGAASGNVATTGTITSSLTGNFGPFTFGYGNYPIPLKLISFTANRKNGTSYLKWITENEQNVDHFEVQRSYDGVLYSKIGIVGARNSGSLESYLFEDPTALNGLAYYRLKSIDFDLKYSFSNIAIVSEYDLKGTGIIAVNPAHSTITLLNKTGKEGTYNYQLYSSSGQLLGRGIITMSVNGGAGIPVPATMRSGACYLELSNGTETYKHKILIQ